MKMTTWIPLSLAIVLGLAAAFVAKNVLTKGKGEAGPPQLHIVVAKQNVPPGKALTPEDLTISPVAGEARPDGSFDQIDAVTGRVLTTQLVKGQVVVETLLAARGAEAGVQNLVPDGYRLITIEVNEFSSLAGMLAPGCRVDILAALSDPDTKEMMARTIVENVKVQAVGQRLGAAPPANPDQPQDTGFRSVTLLVTPQEAEAIHVSTTAGRPWMVLRNPDDVATNKSAGVTLAELRGNAKMEKGGTEDITLANALKKKAASSAQADNNQRTVTYIRGGKLESVSVEAPAAAKPDAVMTDTPTGPAIER